MGNDNEGIKNDQPAAPEKNERKGGTRLDAELELYRDLVETPKEFGEGFSWVSVAGALFCGLLMFPGAIYLGLLAGLQLNQAATWVTVIVFSEIMRRALRTMSKNEMVILLMVAGAMIGGNAIIPGGPFGQMIWRQYLVTSDAAKDVGLYGKFPGWYAPAPDSIAIEKRTFFHIDWAIPILLLFYMTVIGFIKRFTLGFALFRLTSDIERLPFPMAPVGAQGVMALVEGEKGERTWRWTAFSTGTVLGLAFGILRVGIPAVSSAFLEKPIMVIPLPWLDLTRVTDSILPATATGIIIDVGLILLGFVIPFWAVLGSASSVLITFIVNPVLYHTGILTSWRPGMETVNTQIANKVDFYFSTNIGIALGIAAVSTYQTLGQVRRSIRDIRAKRRKTSGRMTSTEYSANVNRGDWSMKLSFIGYFLAAASMIAICKYLVPDFPITFLILFAFLYTPLVSYLNARISGIAGQHVEIPFVRQAFILLSGAKGVAPWIAPIPIENYGNMPQQFRTIELTGTKFTSMVKAWLLTTPLIFVLSFVFWSFLWQDSPIPSDLYPYAQKIWDLRARSQMIMWSATTGSEDAVTLFERSWHPGFIGVGFLFSTVVFTVLSIFGLPTMFIYGMARGLGEGLPHGLLMELFGALLARYYFHKRFGRKPFLQTAPILLAGYFVGQGLIGMGAVSIRLINAAVSMAPF
ncbi:MAG: peptide transporter [Candidatus Pacebacteria bacterium]|nr:peptide transporter [Candidatus Paceibacterota bacterium]